MISKRLMYSAIIGVFALGLNGCISVPPEAVALNDRVTAGIGLLEENSLAILDAYETTLYAAIEEGFDDRYDDAERIIRSGSSVPDTGSLSDSQTRDVAALTLLIIEDAKAAARALVDEKREVVRSNAAAVTTSNESISRMLRAQSLLTQRRTTVVDQVSSLLPINLTASREQASLLLDTATRAAQANQ